MVGVHTIDRPPPEKQPSAWQGARDTAFVCTHRTTSLDARLFELEQNQAGAGWPPDHSPNIGTDFLTPVLAWRLAASPHIQRAYGRTGLDEVGLLDAGDIEAAPRLLRTLIEAAVSGSTISCFESRRILASYGMPPPESLADVGAAVAVAQLALRQRRREILAAELLSSTSTVHRTTVLERLAELEGAA